MTTLKATPTLGLFKKYLTGFALLSLVLSFQPAMAKWTCASLIKPVKTPFKLVRLLVPNDYKVPVEVSRRHQADLKFMAELTLFGPAERPVPYIIEELALALMQNKTPLSTAFVSFKARIIEAHQKRYAFFPFEADQLTEGIYEPILDEFKRNKALKSYFSEHLVQSLLSLSSETNMLKKIKLNESNGRRTPVAGDVEKTGEAYVFKVDGGEYIELPEGFFSKDILQFLSVLKENEKEFTMFVEKNIDILVASYLVGTQGKKSIERSKRHDDFLRSLLN